METPYVLMGQLASVYYFAYYLVLGPLAGVLGDWLLFDEGN